MPRTRLLCQKDRGLKKQREGKRRWASEEGGSVKVRVGLQDRGNTVIATLGLSRIGLGFGIGLVSAWQGEGCITLGCCVTLRASCPHAHLEGQVVTDEVP